MVVLPLPWGALRPTTSGPPADAPPQLHQVRQRAACGAASSAGWGCLTCPPVFELVEDPEVDGQVQVEEPTGRRQADARARQAQARPQHGRIVQPLFNWRDLDRLVREALEVERPLLCIRQAGRQTGGLTLAG